MHDTPSRASYISGLFAFFIGRIADMFSNVNWADVASATGIVIGVATFLVNWYYKKKDFELNDQQNMSAPSRLLLGLLSPRTEMKFEHQKRACC